MLNGSVDLLKLRETYDSKKMVIIPNCLLENVADSLFNFLDHIMAEDWWYASFSPAENVKNEMTVRNMGNNVIEIDRRHKEIEKMLKSGKSCHSYYVTESNHYKSCQCAECLFVRMLKGDIFIEFINAVTGAVVLDLIESRSTLFLPGNFSGPKVRKNNGKVGMIYNLSKNWKPQFGGNLCSLEKDCYNVKKTIVPCFNQMILFDVPAMVGTSTYISHVATGVNVKRLAIEACYG